MEESSRPERGGNCTDRIPEMSPLTSPLIPQQKLRYCDYYGQMSYADLQVFEAACAAGTADPHTSYDISAAAA
jgi:hypothetical protein